MHRWSSLEDVPADLGPTVATLGNFDGVHRGHRAVVDTVTRTARERGLASVAVTFDPHPVAVLHPERAPAAIASLEHRLELLEELGLDAVVVIEFTHEYARLTPEAFVRETFVDGLRSQVVVVGEDTRFGLHNTGDIHTMRELGARFGFEVVVQGTVGDHLTDGLRSWSSSALRTAIAEGNMRSAAEILNRPHRVSGLVVHGHKRGRDLGYPTANLSADSEGLVPADGVYAGWLERPALDPGHPDRRLPAAISVGTNPTFGDVERTVEAYALDRTDLELYGEEVWVDFVQRLRANLRFDSVDALLEQMATDVDHTRELLA
ncbi:bifunctional riboflavin kinase/FAD synthetase [Ornithinimicrobium pekingense]|uniref:Riboflavin biosynthesis protein n=1 Tax=Ornithinimicrobium pekingense TaxID=384677 RepID=A0ABQ2F555_9MICO|nr:bifunctional riboflavin kinase/FAD synthetase [Ornithinimicrobium pekingense]GGK61979.1 riboflavin biosynthesis protein [Ornithinimicrobium pekingense]